ncbi:hypothetical protein G9A89_000361, partial [Geosiphon pyriformis]
RRQERAYRREFQDLLDKRESGEDVDDDRLYCLELYARRQLGEELSEDELLDLADFEKEEQKAATLKAAASASASASAAAVTAGTSDGKEIGPRRDVSEELVVSPPGAPSERDDDSSHSQSSKTRSEPHADVEAASDAKADFGGVVASDGTFGVTPSLGPPESQRHVEAYRANAETSWSSSSSSTSRSSTHESDDNAPLPPDRSSITDHRSGSHLETMNQPIVDHESDGDSLGSGDIFETQRGEPPARTILEAAKKAAQAIKEQDEQQTQQNEAIGRRGEEETKESTTESNADDIPRTRQSDDPSQPGRVPVSVSSAASGSSSSSSSSASSSVSSKSFERSARSSSTQGSRTSERTGQDKSLHSEEDKSQPSQSKAQDHKDQTLVSEPMFHQSIEDDSTLSSGEIDELNSLLDHQERGDVVDEARLYELDLFDKYHSGEILDESEQKALTAFRLRRRQERAYRREFQDLLDKRESGEDVDDDRLYCLELYARRQLVIGPC